jgi:C-terminal processing protease CtpA/Prc
MRILTVLILSSFYIYSESLAQDVYRPKLVNSKSGEHHDFPLGVLEATGRLQDGDREILIMDVGKGGAAELAGLKVGDRIAKIENMIPGRFSKKTDTGLAGPQDLIGRSLDRKAAASNALLSIEIFRGEQSQKLKISLPKCR